MCLDRKIFQGTLQVMMVSVLSSMELCSITTSPAWPFWLESYGEGNGNFAVNVSGARISAIGTLAEVSPMRITSVAGSREKQREVVPPTAWLNMVNGHIICFHLSQTEHFDLTPSPNPAHSPMITDIFPYSLFSLPAFLTSCFYTKITRMHTPFTS